MPLAIYALAVAAFAIGTAEFIVAGILPPLANDLGVTIPTAGLLVTAYAIGVAIGGPVLALMTARLPPKPLIVSLLLLFAVSQVLCAIAPDYTMLLLARLLSSLAHGLFFGLGNVFVMRLVPKERRGGAFALFIGGITVSNLLGVPIGTAIGVAFGWRVTFVVVGLMGLVGALALAWQLPKTRADEHPHQSIASQFRALRHQEVFLSYLIIALVMVGVISFSTYQVPMLIEVTHVRPEHLPFYLLAGGIGSVLGIYAGGAATDWKPMPALIVVLVLQAATYFAMSIFMQDLVGMAVLMFLGGVFGFAFSTPLQARIVHAAREAPNFASALTSTAFNIGIAGGAALGGGLLNAGVVYMDLPALGIATGLAGAALAGLSFWLERRKARRA